MKKKQHIILIFALFAITQIALPQQKATPENTPNKANARPEKPAPDSEPFDDTSLEAMAKKCVVFETGEGKITLGFFPEVAPFTVRNFLNLTAIGAWDNTTFSRTVPNFIIQGGNVWTNEAATEKIKWRAAKTLPDEPNGIKHEPGVISMARGDEPNSATTNFFILLTTADYLDGKFAAFGRVTEGMDVVKAINEKPAEGETPKDPIRIKTAKVIECVPNSQ
ncbi:MAG: peptidylprolyl isomerase [Pyrinomonadaceae bacterium]